MPCYGLHLVWSAGFYQIRCDGAGSASKDLAALVPLINQFTSPFLGFCTDDRNPLAIYEEGHLDHLVRRAIALGAPLAAVYRTASWSAARGFGLVDRGLVAPGYLADFLLLGALENCAIHSVIRPGRRAGTSTPRLQSAEGGVSCPNPFVM